MGLARAGARKLAHSDAMLNVRALLPRESGGGAPVLGEDDAGSEHLRGYMHASQETLLKLRLANDRSMKL